MLPVTDGRDLPPSPPLRPFPLRFRGAGLLTAGTSALQPNVSQHYRVGRCRAQETRVIADHLNVNARAFAVPDDELLPINVDVVGTVTLVLGVLPALRGLRAQITEELPRFDLARFDKLEQYALALNHAHAVHRSTLPNKRNVAELNSELAEICDRLFADAMSLSNYRLVDGARPKECKTSPSYRATATDVFTIVTVFKEVWPRIEGRTPVTLPALAEAGNKALDLLAAVGVRDQGTGDDGRGRAHAPEGVHAVLQRL